MIKPSKDVNAIAQKLIEILKDDVRDVDKVQIELVKENSSVVTVTYDGSFLKVETAMSPDEVIEDPNRPKMRGVSGGGSEG